jgi:hypothetical protein
MEFGCSQRWDCWQRKPGAEDHIAKIRCQQLVMRATGYSGVLRLSKGMYKKLHAFSNLRTKVNLFPATASKRALLSC